MNTPAIQINAPTAGPPVITPRRSIAVALLLSLAVHAIVILALIDWSGDAPDAASIVRATLTHTGAPAATSPDAAAAAPARPVVQPRHDPPGAGEDPAAEPRPTRLDHELPATVLATKVGDGSGPEANAVIAVEDGSAAPTSRGLNLDYAESLRRIARLDADNPAGSPRVRRIAEGRAHTAEDTWYLESWRRKVERIGRLNYPGQARANRLYGSLRLLVAIEPDGTLRDVRVVDSSGHKVLDEAAVRIVRLAAPYAPFPPGMRERTDVLEIVRTWRFKQRGDASIS